jgi:hypothetical protein
MAIDRKPIWISMFIAGTLMASIFVPQYSFACAVSYSPPPSLPPRISGETAAAYDRRIVKMYGYAGERAIAELETQARLWRSASHVIVVETIALAPRTEFVRDGWPAYPYTIGSVQYWLKGRGRATRLRINNAHSLCGGPTGGSGNIGDIRVVFAFDGIVDDLSFHLSQIKHPILIEALRSHGIVLPRN